MRGDSDHFLNSLLRMTYWYESALRDDPKDRSLRNAGLFRNHGGAFTGSPWETSEAYLAMTVRLKLDRQVREAVEQFRHVERQAQPVQVLAQAVEDANLLGPDLVMTVGDLVQGYKRRAEWLEQMREYRGVMDRLRCPWYPVAGNHDIYWSGGPAPILRTRERTSYRPGPASAWNSMLAALTPNR